MVTGFVQLDLAIELVFARSRWIVFERLASLNKSPIVIRISIGNFERQTFIAELDFTFGKGPEVVVVPVEVKPFTGQRNV